MHKAGPTVKFPNNAMTLIANSNTKYVIRVDFNDDWVGMEISIMAHQLPIEQNVCNNK